MCRRSAPCATTPSACAAANWSALKGLARGEDPAAALDALSQRLTNKLLHEPTQALHRTDGERGEVRALIARLYRLPVE